MAARRKRCKACGLLPKRTRSGGLIPGDGGCKVSEPHFRQTSLGPLLGKIKELKAMQLGTLLDKKVKKGKGAGDDDDEKMADSLSRMKLKKRVRFVDDDQQPQEEEHPQAKKPRRTVKAIRKRRGPINGSGFDQEYSRQDPVEGGTYGALRKRRRRALDRS